MRQQNYSKKSMRELTMWLSQGYIKQLEADFPQLSRSTIENTLYGKQYHKEVVAAVEKMSRKAQRNFSK